MGNSTSDSQDENTLQMQTIKQAETEAYGDIELVKDPINKNVYGIKKFQFESKSKLSEFMEIVESKKEICGDNIVMLHGVNSNKSNDFCSNYFGANLRYLYFPETLQHLIQKIKGLKKKFSEDEIFYLVDCVASGLQQLQEHNITHQDIRPQTILISRLDRSFKLTDIQFLTQYTQYKRLLLGTMKTNYLSPQLFSQLQQRILDPKVVHTKSDIFSLGLVCLEMASLENMENIYDWDSFMLNEEKVEEIILNLKDRGASDKLIELLLHMLQIEESDRITLPEISYFLLPLKKQYSQNAFSKFADSSLIKNNESRASTYLPSNYSFRPSVNQSQVSHIEKIQGGVEYISPRGERSSEEIKRSKPSNHQIYDQTGQENVPSSSYQHFQKINLDQWERNVQQVGEDVEVVLHSTNKLQEQYSSLQRPSFENRDIENMIQKRAQRTIPHHAQVGDNNQNHHLKNISCTQEKPKQAYQSKQQSFQQQQQSQFILPSQQQHQQVQQQIKQAPQLLKDEEQEYMQSQTIERQIPPSDIQEYRFLHSHTRPFAQKIRKI